MKKTTGVLSALLITIAAVTTAGAWYTGKQLPGELERALVVVNHQLKQALIGSGGSMTLELASLDQHLFTSTAHYRLKANDLQSGAAPIDFEVGVVDTLEHGPFPWSRVKALKLLPVMVASNARLQKDDGTAAWFAAAGERSPLQGHFSMGYGGGVDGKITLLPLKQHETDGNALDFSGLELLASSDRDGDSVKLHGTAGKLDLTVVGEDHPPIKMLFNGLSIDADLTSTGHAMVYGGAVNAALAEGRFTLGPQQDVAILKRLEVSSLSTVTDDKMDGRIQYKLGDMTYNGRAVGAGEMVFSMKRYDIPAFQSLMQWYATKLPQVQAAQAAGVAFPTIDMTEQERTKVHADLSQLLSSRPQFALENLSFKTANGESRLSLTVDLANPSSFDLPPDQLGRQVVTQVQGKLVLSKPMIGDLATLQALLENQGDPQAIARQAGQAGEMVGMMAVQSGLATVQGNDVVTSVHYVDGMVDFNGRKMTVEAFAMLLAGLLQGAVGPQG